MRLAGWRTRTTADLRLEALACAALAAGLAAACDGGGGTPHPDDGAGAEDGWDLPETEAPETDGEAPDAPDAEALTCIDVDGDGHGRYCAAGGDCDDANALVWDMCTTCTDLLHAPPGCDCLATVAYGCYEGPAGTEGVGACAPGARPCVDGHLSYDCVGQTLPAPEEICGDLVDNDCNRVGDEEAMSPCRDCDETCHSRGDVEPEATDPGATGVEINPDGPGIVLGVDEIRAAYAWAPNTDEGSVSKVDVYTGAEVGRYRVGQTGTASDAPSRTAVDQVGDLYVANQANVSAIMTQGSVTKIAGDVSHCIDKNDNGLLETSTGSTRLPVGTDECVLWTAPVGGPGAVPRALAVYDGPAGSAGVPWVGCAEELVFYELHPGNGSVTGTVPVEVEPYGAAAGGGAWIWVAGQSSTAGPGIQRFDAVMGGLDPVVVVPEGCGPEGIAVDSSGAVWVGTRNRQVCRYSPAEAAWTQVAVQWPQSYGVSVAADGVVWVANYDPTHAALSYFPAADPSTVTHVTVPGSSPYAVSADGFGYVWTANYAGNSLTRYTVADGSTAEYPVGRGPSAYSDFTGLQRTIIATSGTWHADFERCAVAEGDRWGVVRWDAETTGTSSVTLSAATAATATELDTAVPVTLVTIPPGSLTPVDIEAAFAAASIASGAHLRLTATLTAGAEGESPVLRTVDVQWHCAGEG